MERFGQLNYVLGLDLGVNSTGWAVIELDGTGDPLRIIKLGSRIFEAGVEGSLEKIAAGEGISRNIERREARQMRRQIDRRRRRRSKLLHILQSACLLPAGSAAEVLPKLDKQFLEAHRAQLAEVPAPLAIAHTLPYYLRRLALDKPLGKFELGRALYHLGQRRGFWNNRRSPRREDEDLGKVETGISDLEKKIADSGARTLGEYFSCVNPQIARIRSLWTARMMYEDEFEKIWDAQSPHHTSILTDDLKKRVKKAIFHQRPLKSVKHLIGYCEHEPRKRRAPWAVLDAQRFRLLQQVNNLRILYTDGRAAAELSLEQRSSLIERLQKEGDCKFTEARKLLGLKRCTFNLEEGGEKTLAGNRTNAKLAAIFGPRWWEMTGEQRDTAVEDVHSFEKAEALKNRAVKHWRLGEDAAKRLSEITLERDYCNLSRKAMRKLLPLMEQGTPYSTAVKTVYGEFHKKVEPVAFLPPLKYAMPDPRNPTVSRVLTEMRKVVNAVISRYGKPAFIRIELARDMRRSKKQRKLRADEMRKREIQRKAAAKKIVKEMPQLGEPREGDKVKVLLAEECRWFCPYTGKCISMEALLGPNPQFDIAHIIPFSRCLDDSFVNKTLCYHEENRNVMTNKTPWEAYGHNEEILKRVRKFRGAAAKEKLRRFQLQEIGELNEDGFVSSQLNDTRYASVLAVHFLSLLYGGDVDADGIRRIQAGRGGATKFLRDEWGLNSILDDGGKKTRRDHRHHAVDAVAIALTSAATVKMLADAAQRAPQEGRRRFAAIKSPWTDFWKDVEAAVDEIIVSHRVSRKTSGPLHKETLYGKPRKDPNGRDCRHIHKLLSKLHPGDLGKIVDEDIGHIVCAKLEELHGDFDGLIAPENHPFIKAKDGRLVPIHGVRVRVYDKPLKIGGDGNPRYVLSEANHHMEILRDMKTGFWSGCVVPLIEAARRAAKKLPVVRKDHGPSKEFLFSIAPGDTLEIDGEQTSSLVVVRSVSKGKIEYVNLNEARLKAEIQKGDKGVSSGRGWTTRSPNELAKVNCRKVTVSPLGEVRRASD